MKRENGKLWKRRINSKESWEDKWEKSSLKKRIDVVELFAINHGFPQWEGETIPEFISTLYKEAYEEGKKDSKATECVFLDNIYRFENMTFGDWKNNIRKEAIEEVIEAIPNSFETDNTKEFMLSPKSLEWLKQSLKERFLNNK